MEVEVDIERWKIWRIMLARDTWKIREKWKSKRMEMSKDQQIKISLARVQTLFSNFNFCTVTKGT